MKTSKGYKLFEQDEQGNLYALFIDKNTIMPIDVWINAGIFPTKGFSVRPGFHIGEIPSAPWLCSADGTYKSQRRKHWKRVWAEVEYVSENDHTKVAAMFPGKCLRHTLPYNGFYFFKEAGVGRIWIIADQMKITRILTEKERMEVLKGMNYNEAEAFAPYKAAFEKRAATIAS